MRPAMLVIITSLCVIAMPRQAEGQSSDATITFNVPLDLKQVSSDIAKVAVFCEITSAALPAAPGGKGSGNLVRKQQEVAVTNGQVVTTVSVVFSITGLTNAVGTRADYHCSLSGYSTSLQRWDVFHDASPTPSFRLTPTPTALTGSFVW